MMGIGAGISQSVQMLTNIIVNQQQSNPAQNVFYQNSQMYGSHPQPYFSQMLNENQFQNTANSNNKH